MRTTNEYEKPIGKRTKHFTEVICSNSGRGFVQGDIYAMGEASNNAFYILTHDRLGDPVNFPVHCVGGDLLPADGQGWYTEKCPVFEIIS